ncbi:MAG: LPS export ABC transporter ATP-binding protein [Nitrospiraceae bacterium]|nr:LPS export ABC transporter ATP-binding protein [Nitrospiraceae bacterium]
MHSLEIKGITKNYGNRCVVNNLTLNVKTGEIVGLLGPNGAGKTTTFYMIVGMIKPESGSIFLDGEDIGQLPMYQKARRGISYLPQEASIFRKLSVRDNLRAVLEIKGYPDTETDEMIESLIDEFNLSKFADRDGYRLSGGERRRSEIARSLALKPTFILFDEPFTGIDPLAIIELKKMLTYLKNKGLGIIITDHNVRDTLSITDRAYIISNGNVLAEGAPHVIVENPQVQTAYLGEGFKFN